MNGRPSSGTTAAGVAGAIMTLLWGLLSMFTEYRADAQTIAASVTLAIFFAGWLKCEKVYKMEKREPEK